MRKSPNQIWSQFAWFLISRFPTWKWKSWQERNVMKFFPSSFFFTQVCSPSTSAISLKLNDSFFAERSFVPFCFGWKSLIKEFSWVQLSNTSELIGKTQRKNSYKTETSEESGNLQFGIKIKINLRLWDVENCMKFSWGMFTFSHIS